MEGKPGSRDKTASTGKGWPTHSNAPRKFNQIRIGKQVSFYLTVRKLITFARAVSMEWRDWKPDCSGLTSEWETASVDNSLQTRGHLASGR